MNIFSLLSVLYPIPAWGVHLDNSPRSPSQFQFFLTIIKRCFLLGRNLGSAFYPKIHLLKSIFTIRSFLLKTSHSVQRLKPSSYITGNDTLLQTGCSPGYHPRTRERLLTLDSWSLFPILHICHSSGWMSQCMGVLRSKLQVQCIPWAVSPYSISWPTY